METRSASGCSFSGVVSALAGGASAGRASSTLVRFLKLETKNKFSIIRDSRKIGLKRSYDHRIALPDLTKKGSYLLTRRFVL